MQPISNIGPCLWFDNQGEDAAKFYVSVFPNSKTIRTSHYTDEGRDIHHQPAGKVMAVEFELDGHTFTALNGGPLFKFSEAISFMISCDTQAAIDYYWDKLSQGGDPSAQQCGWLKDRFGVSWQVVPTVMAHMMADPDTAKMSRVMKVMLPMKKLNIAQLERAYAGT